MAELGEQPCGWQVLDLELEGWDGQGPYLGEKRDPFGCVAAVESSAGPQGAYLVKGSPVHEPIVGGGARQVIIEDEDQLPVGGGLGAELDLVGAGVDRWIQRLEHVLGYFRPSSSADSGGPVISV